MSYESRYDALYESILADLTPGDALDAINEASTTMLGNILDSARAGNHEQVGLLVSALISHYANQITESEMPSEDEYDREVAEAAAEARWEAAMDAGEARSQNL